MGKVKVGDLVSIIRSGGRESLFGIALSQLELYTSISLSKRPIKIIKLLMSERVRESLVYVDDEVVVHTLRYRRLG